MFNITGKYIKIWKAEDKGNVVKVDLSTSKKNKDGSYTNSNYMGCAFVGGCLSLAKELEKGDTIEIINGMIGKREYNGKWYDDVVVFDFSIMQKGKGSQNGDPDEFEVDDSEDEIPF